MTQMRARQLAWMDRKVGFLIVVGGYEWNRRVKSGGEGPAPKQLRVWIWGSLYKFLVILEKPRHIILWWCIVLCLFGHSG